MSDVHSPRSKTARRTLSAYGADKGDFRAAHHDSTAWIGEVGVTPREQREELAEQHLSPGATRAVGAGNRESAEEPDPFRTCFERDLDRIQHSTAFRRLAGKTQVVFAPTEDMLRTRLTHSLEVAQVAEAVATRLGLNTALARAIALGHDCGHGPGGHAAEEAFDELLPGGWDHAEHGPSALAGLNLTAEVLDGIRHHSWRLDAPSTPEGEICSWADRISYTFHDLDDFLRCRIVRPHELPLDAEEITGGSHGDRIGYFVDALVRGSLEAGAVRMRSEDAQVLDTYRRFAFERIYLSEQMSGAYQGIVSMLTSLVSFYAENPSLAQSASRPGGTEAVRDAVNWVAGMTDRYACEQAVLRLGWSAQKLPRVQLPG